MKKIFIFFAFAIAAIESCQSPYSQKAKINLTDSTYTITGKIAGLDSGWVYLMHNQSEPRFQDSTRIDSGFFTFKGKTAYPEFFMLGIPNNGNKEFRLGFFVDNAQINISGKKDSVADAIITGSATQDEYKNFIASQKSLDEEEGNLDKLYDSVKAKKDEKLIDSLKNIFKLFEKKQKDFVNEYVKQHPSSYVAARHVYQNFSYNPDAEELGSIYNNLDTTIQNSYYGKKIKGVLDIARKTAIGKAAPEFAQNNVDGKPISLELFKGKYVLVDFWASWCGPCRAENPTVVKAYRKFHPKGFDILGVSLDDEKNKWKEAIKKDNLSWIQVSDLQGWKNSVAELYGVEGIPMNFLVDKEGKIIGKGLRGEDLEKKLSELLK